MSIKLKVCGLKYLENIQEVAHIKPDYMGFIFYEKSPRYFVGALPELPESIQKVGVFVKASIETIVEKVIKYNLDLVQLHGGESVDFCQKLTTEFRKNNLKHIPLIKVFGIENKTDLENVSAFEPVCDYFLFDTKSERYGGTGSTFDWSLLQNYTFQKPFFLSGGIGLDNLNQIFKLTISIHALDVNSKFEQEPGLKNSTQLKILKHELSR